MSRATAGREGAEGRPRGETCASNVPPLCLARYLRRDSPEEWPVSRLARSFEVSPDVVARVLRSRFSPSLERAVKQDSRVQFQLSGAFPAPEPSGAFPAPEPRGSLLLLPAPAGAAQPLAPEVASRKKAGRGAPPPAGSRQQGRSATPADQDQEPSLQVVQRGHEFVDGDGNFLYRIPA